MIQFMFEAYVSDWTIFDIDILNKILDLNPLNINLLPREFYILAN